MLYAMAANAVTAYYIDLKGELPTKFAKGERVATTIQVKNITADVINSFDVVFTAGENTNIVVPVTLSEPLTTKEYKSINIKNLHIDEIGEMEAKISINNVNGDNSIPQKGKTITQAVKVYPELYPHNSIVEDATGVDCQYCGAVVKVMEEAKTNLENDGFIGFAYHWSYDGYKPSGCANFYSHVSGYPTVYFNRDYTSVQKPSYSQLEGLAKDTYADRATVKVEPMITYNTTTKKADVTTVVRFAEDMEDTDYSLSLIITEDHLGPVSQATESASFTTYLNDVVRTGSIYDPIKNIFPKNVTAGEDYTYERELDASYVTNYNYGSVTAILIDNKTGLAVNALRKPLTGGPGTGVETLPAEDIEDADAPAEYFNINGTRLSGEPSAHGIYVKIVNGKASKIVK